MLLVVPVRDLDPRDGSVFAHVGDVVGVLVPDSARGDPAVFLVADYLQRGRAPVVGDDDDFSRTIVVDIDDHGVLDGGVGCSDR